MQGIQPVTCLSLNAGPFFETLSSTMLHPVRHAGTPLLSPRWIAELQCLGGAPRLQLLRLTPSARFWSLFWRAPRSKLCRKMASTSITGGSLVGEGSDGTCLSPEPQRHERVWPPRLQRPAVPETRHTGACPPRPLPPAREKSV